jgi:hypothetical protein
MADRRRDAEKRKEVAAFLARTKNHGPLRRSIISSKTHYVTVEEVIKVGNGNGDDAALVIVRDSKGELWEIRACHDPEEGDAVRDCNIIMVGMELKIELREVWMVAPETVCRIIRRRERK